MNLQDLYEIAKKHKDEHVENKRRCGGEPYKSYEKLFEIVDKFCIGKENVRILEIGTAVGFTTYILQKASNAQIDTIELYSVHADLAKKNISDWGGNVGKINFFVGEAENILPTLRENSYDLIFFDGFGVKFSFCEHFENLLKKDGILITANKHLKSTDQKYFTEINTNKKWEFLEEFADTQVHKKMW